MKVTLNVNDEASNNEEFPYHVKSLIFMNNNRLFIKTEMT